MDYQFAWTWFVLNHILVHFLREIGEAMHHD